MIVKKEEFLALK
jgi:hypothetical protein